MKHKIKQHLSLAEAANLLRQPDQRKLKGLRDWCILSLMIHAGLRRAEVCSLRRGSFKIEDKKIWLYVLGKGNRERKIPVADPELLTALERYFSKVGSLGSPEAPAFFRVKYFRAEDRPKIGPETIRRLVEKYIKMAGLTKRITPHSLRHTCLTLHLQAGADLATVQALAGHSSCATTSRYLHTSEELLAAAVERLKL